MRTIIKNACIITCDGGRVIPDGFVQMDDDKITSVGDMAQLKVADGTHIIDAGGRIVMPGLVNAHMHLYSQFARGLAVPKMASFLEILDGLWWRLDKVLTGEDVLLSAKLGLIEAIKCGVTTVIDHHASYGCTKGSLEEIAKAFNDVGVRGVLCYEVSDRNGEKECETAIYENLTSPQDGLIRRMFGLHASLTLSPATLKKVRKANEKLNLPYHIHVAEGPEDLEDARSQYGKSVVARLYDEGMLAPNSIAAHCIHINDDDIGLLKKSKAFVVHNPLSNMNNAVGRAPYLKMCAAGIPVGIGTDGMSAGIFGDVKAAAFVHKNSANDPQAGWMEVQNSTLKVNPTIASKMFGKDIGVLKAGAAADVIITDCIPFTRIDENNYWGHVLFGVANAKVHTTICAGKVLMEGYELKTIDEGTVIDEAKKLSQAMWKRFKKNN